MFSGRLDQSRFVKIIKTKGVAIDLDHSVAYHIDGEAMEGVNRFTVELKPASLKVLVPAKRGRLQKYPI